MIDTIHLLVMFEINEACACMEFQIVCMYCNESY